MQIFTRIKNPDQNPIHKSRKEKKKSWAMKTHTHTHTPKKKKTPKLQNFTIKSKFWKISIWDMQIGVSTWVSVCVCVRERERERERLTESETRCFEKCEEGLYVMCRRRWWRRESLRVGSHILLLLLTAATCTSWKKKKHKPGYTMQNANFSGSSNLYCRRIEFHGPAWSHPNPLVEKKKKKYSKYEIVY